MKRIASRGLLLYIVIWEQQLIKPAAQSPDDNRSITTRCGERIKMNSIILIFSIHFRMSKVIMTKLCSWLTAQPNSFISTEGLQFDIECSVLDHYEKNPRFSLCIWDIGTRIRMVVKMADLQNLILNNNAESTICLQHPWTILLCVSTREGKNLT